MGCIHSSHNSRKVHPAGVIYSKKRYFVDGRTLLTSRSIAAINLKRTYGTMVYPDGSYIEGMFLEGEATGYCIYRDIANRLIYTGYMDLTQYSGWGAIWDETGSYPEYITYWCASQPGNRMLHITPMKYEWVTYEDEDPKYTRISKVPKELDELYTKKIEDVKINTMLTEDEFQDLIKVYTELRSQREGSPPSPNIGPKAFTFHERVKTPSPPTLPPTSPSFHLTPSASVSSKLYNIRSSVSKGEDELGNTVSVKNPLMFRVPPRLPI